MENFNMFFCQKKSLKISGRQSLTGRIILNAYPVIWLLPESNTRTMQLLSSVRQDRIILLPGNEITKVRNTKHYDKIYKKSNSYNTKQTTIHEGYIAQNMEKNGTIADRCEINRQIRADSFPL